MPPTPCLLSTSPLPCRRTAPSPPPRQWQVTPEQTELVYSQGEGETPPAPGGKVHPVILLLAGVVKFNSTLKSLTLSSGLNNNGAESVATAVRENTTLEHLDVSGQHAIDAEGVQLLCESVRSHPKLQSVKIEGTTSLPIAQLRGTAGSEAVLNVAHLGLGVLSAHAMGTLLRGNLLLGSLNLDHNPFGAGGIKAIVEGLGEAPIKSLHLKGSGLAGTEDDVLKGLSESICSNIGQLGELRMDENDLACEPEALAPMCKLRSLRTLSIEKNRLSRVPALIGTMLSLRHLLLYSNQLIDLPACLCLITGLEVLDVHKNLITALPQNIGKLTSLKKMVRRSPKSRLEVDPHALPTTSPSPSLYLLSSHPFLLLVTPPLLRTSLRIRSPSSQSQSASSPRRLASRAAATPSRSPRSSRRDRGSA